MEFITGKHLDRRTFLRGMGASLALPYLDAMVPAGRMSGAVTRANESRTPMIAIEEVHGLAGCNEWGATQEYGPLILYNDCLITHCRDIGATCSAGAEDN